MDIVYVFIIGLLIGSFLNIFIDKIEQEKYSMLQHVIVSLISAVSYTLVFYLYGLNFYMIKYCTFFSIMLIIAVIDFNTKNVYSNISIVATVFALSLDLYEFLILQKNFTGYIYGAIIAFLIFFPIVKIMKAMGEGDIEVMVICGLFLGVSHTLFTILLSFIVGGIAGVLLMLFKNKNRKDEIAFIPYIALGAYMAVFVGEYFINWYMKCY